MRWWRSSGPAVWSARPRSRPAPCRVMKNEGALPFFVVLGALLVVGLVLIGFSA